MSADLPDRLDQTLRGLPVPGPLRRVVGVAIPVPEPHGPELQRKRAAYNDPLADSIPTHVTLLGPTAIGRHGLSDLEAHLEQVAARSTGFRMELRGTGTFRPVSAVVFVQLARGIAGCERLETLIRSGAYYRELVFPYHPHVTVAHDVAEHDLDRAFDELADYRAVFEVDAIWLYEQGMDGRWEPLRGFPLLGRDG